MSRCACGGTCATGCGRKAERAFTRWSTGHWRLRSGGWSCTASASTATVVDGESETPLVTDGPYLESKEYLGGFWVIAATDMDEATAWAARAAAATTLPIEVRQIAGPGLR